MSAHEDLRSAFQSTTGGVMTVEVGAITGDLELCTALSPAGLEAKVRYAGAGEWYAVEGSPAPRANLPADDHHAAHQRVLQVLTTPGPVEHGNEMPVFLGSRL